MINIYILQKGNSNHYKIGFTNNLDRRLKQLQTGNDDVLFLVLSAKTRNKELEKMLHRKFRHFKINGEWFELNDYHLKEIKRIFENYKKSDPNTESD